MKNTSFKQLTSNKTPFQEHYDFSFFNISSCRNSSHQEMKLASRQSPAGDCTVQLSILGTSRAVNGWNCSFVRTVHFVKLIVYFNRVKIMKIIKPVQNAFTFVKMKSIVCLVHVAAGKNRKYTSYWCKPEISMTDYSICKENMWYTDTSSYKQSQVIYNDGSVQKFEECYSSYFFLGSKHTKSQ